MISYYIIILLLLYHYCYAIDGILQENAQRNMINVKAIIKIKPIYLKNQNVATELDICYLRI